MKNNQEIFADNAAPINQTKIIIAGHDGQVKKLIIDIAASSATIQKETHPIAQSIKSVTIVKQQLNSIRSIAMSNDTHTLFVADEKGIITQFQKEESSLNYYQVRIFKWNTWKINFISLSNSKMHLLSASWDKTLMVWDLQNGTQLACLNEERKEHKSTILSCCWNDQDTLFASGDQEGDLVVWSPPSPIYNTSNQFIPFCKFEAQGDTSSIWCLKFQENGLDLFASYFESGVIRLWSINEKELLDSKSMHPKRESEKLKGKIEQFDVRGSMVVVGVKKEILLLNADSLQNMSDAVRFEKVHCHLISSLVISKDGKYVASGRFDGSLAIFDSKSGKCVKHIKNAHSQWVDAIVFQI